MELSFWGACGIVGVGKSDKVITGGASKALPERCKQKIRRLKNSGFQTVEKPLSMIKMGCRVLLALLVLHRAKLLASNQSILALGVAPSGVRAAAPHSAPARTPGVYAQRLCTMQSQPSIHSPSPRGRGLGLGIENKHFFGKTDFFYSLRATVL